MGSSGSRVQTVGVHMHTKSKKRDVVSSQVRNWLLNPDWPPGPKTGAPSNQSISQKSKGQTGKVWRWGGESDLQALHCGRFKHLGYCLEGTEVPEYRIYVFGHILGKAEDLCMIFNQEHQWEWKYEAAGLGPMKRGWIVMRAGHHLYF